MRINTIMKVFLKVRIYFLFCLLPGLILNTSCNRRSAAKLPLPNAVIASDKTIEQPDTFFVVKDPTQYSPAYLEKLKTSGYAIRYLLADSMLVMNDVDTTFFPTHLPTNKKVELIGQKNDSTISLSVQRKNYTTIAFILKIFDSGNLIDEQAGEADIGGLFFLGAESDEDDQTGDSYFASEYTKTYSSCNLSIRIGSEDDQFKGKIKRYCLDKKKNIDFGCPTLRSKN